MEEPTTTPAAETPVEVPTETPVVETATEKAPETPEVMPAAEETAPAPATAVPEVAAAAPAAAAVNMNAATFIPGGNGPLPAELHGWNWGAFFLTWIWGVGHRTWISLLVFIPLVNIVMPFVLGAKGNEWAWQNRPFASVEQFKLTQKAWTMWGAIVFAVSLLMSILFFGALMAMVGLAAGSDSSMMEDTEYMTDYEY